MRNCNSCQRELDQAAIVQGKCPHCGAILRKLSRRTFDNKRLPAANGNGASDDDVKRPTVEERSDAAEDGDDEYKRDESHEAELQDTDPGSQQNKVQGSDRHEDNPAVDDDNITPQEKGKDLENKHPPKKHQDVK